MQIYSLGLMLLTAFLAVLIFLFNRFIPDEKKSRNAANIALTAGSYVFTAYADPRFALILALLTVSTWFFARLKNKEFIGIIIAVLSLGFFKYTNFFAESFAKLLGKDFTALNIILPLGVSFYTFSAIGYLADVKRGKTEPHSLCDVALYLSFFPKFTSGPIMKSGDFFSQAEKRREITKDNILTGIQIFVFGLFKKIVFADRLSVFVNQVYETPKAFGSLTLALCAVAYSLQIYFDFSGYSDMAVGVGKVLGFNLPRNFNLPYMAHNVTEFWKRWHITLSGWLQEYLYISLGGNRKGKIRTYVNLVLTMVIGGLWHGAGVTYLLWGLLHGLALVVHKLWMNVTKSTEKEPGAVSSAVSIVLTFIFNSFCWIFFRASSVGNAVDIITGIFSFRKGLEQPYLWLFASLTVLIAATAAAGIRSRNNPVPLKKKNVSRTDGYYPVLDLSKFGNLVIFFVFCGIVIALAYTGGSAFIYGKY